MNGSRITRRHALKIAGGALGAAALNPYVSPALAAARWSAEPRLEREGYFVIDGVAHCYNHRPDNIRDPRYRLDTVNGAYSFHEACTPAAWRMTKAQWSRDWDPEQLMDLCLLESETAMICMHSVPLDDMFFDGMVPNWKGAYLKKHYPDRVLWYAALNLFKPLDETLADIDTLLAQGADGFKLYPTRLNLETGQSRGWLMDDEKLAFPVFDRIRARGAKHVAVHKLLGYTGPETAALGVNDVARAARTFPELTFHVVHGGWLLVDDTVQLMNTHPNVTSVMEGPMLWPLYDLPKFNALMGDFLTRTDTDRLIYASTAPIQHPYFILDAFTSYAPPRGAKFRLDAALKQKILGGNLARLHGIDVDARRPRLADDRFARARREHGLREPYITQRTGPLPA